VIFDAMEPFDIVSPWWMRVGVAILGGLSYSVYQLIRTVPREQFVGHLLTKTVPAGVFAGVLAWTFSDLDILGVHADTSHLTGYFVLGLIVSYAGVESLLRRLGRPAAR
jgi:ABC-type phosphate/phosphonate transport system permease subunit